jgi:predicted nucleic acid-binding protein
MGILIDSNFFYALHRKNDKNYNAAKKIFNSDIWKLKGPALTSSLVVNETYTLAMYRTKFNKKLLNDLDQIFWSEDRFFGIATFTLEDYHQISIALSKYSSSRKVLSFVDASLIYLGKSRNYSTIISFDNHFDGIFQRIL